MFNAKKKTRKEKSKAPPEVRGDKGFERLKRKNSRKLFTQRLFYLILLIVLLIVFTVGAVAIFFRVSSVTVKGNGDIYGKDEIVDLLEDIAADVKEGKKPRKSVGGAFIKLCSGVASVAGLATKIIGLVEQLPNG